MDFSLNVGGNRRERWHCRPGIVSATIEAFSATDRGDSRYVRLMEGPYIAEVAALIGDPTRANILAALMDGRALTAGELAYRAHVAPSTASGHLTKMTDGKLVTVTARGRHRYYRLASPRIAEILENLMGFAIDGPSRHRPSFRGDQAMARARTCYHHLAGRLGVALADSFVRRGQIVLSEDGGLITEEGRLFLIQFGANLSLSANSRRALCRPCLDWSERRWHIGGQVGAAIADRCFDLGWIERQPDSRALTITPAGQQAFGELFDIHSIM